MKCSGMATSSAISDWPENLLDTAILNSSVFTSNPFVEKYKKLDEIPFDFSRRMMSVLVENPEVRPSS